MTALEGEAVGVSGGSSVEAAISSRREVAASSLKMLSAWAAVETKTLVIRTA